jgi:hypothetical protein
MKKSSITCYCLNMILAGSMIIWYIIKIHIYFRLTVDAELSFYLTAEYQEYQATHENFDYCESECRNRS